MNQGKIIEYIEQGKVVCSICLIDKGNRLHLLTSLNREVNMSPKRVIYISSSVMDSSCSRDELLIKLRQIEAQRERLKDEIDVKELWELIKDEDESFSFRYLAQLSFGDQTTDDHVSALIRALFNEKLYFKMKEGRFIPLSEEKVIKLIEQRDKAIAKEESIKKGSAWLKDTLGKELFPIPEEMKDVIQAIEGLALYGKESPDHEYGREIMTGAGFKDIGKARELLVRLGVWEEDEPVDIRKQNIRTSFPESILKESGELNRKKIDFHDREDLRDLQVFTIDGPMTQDFDDALSVERIGDRFQVGIHITDVAGIIEPGCGLDEEAAIRGSSLYLPRRILPMFPADLSHGGLSLLEGTDRNAVSLLVTFDADGNIYDYRFSLSMINVKNRLTYEEINEKYTLDRHLSWLYGTCNRLRRNRIKNGALILSLPEVSISVDNSSSVSLEMVSQETPSRMMIAELMILYNWLIARFCRDNKIPILYRHQKEPNERLTIDETNYIYYVYQQRRKIFPLVVDVKPGPHSGLGLDVYSNVSSPIRRYLDLVVQRQVRNFLCLGTPLYNKEELKEIKTRIAPALKNLTLVKRNRIEYWTLKYFQQHVGEEFSSIILDALKSKYRIIIKDFLFTAEIEREVGMDFSPGNEVNVCVKKADPWKNFLDLKFA